MTEKQSNTEKNSNTEKLHPNGFSNLFNRLLPRGSALRNASFLLSSTLLSQTITIAAMPLLSRIYSPADFGIFAVFISFITIASEFFGMRYHYGICLPKQHRFGNALFMLSLWLQSGAALILLGILFFIREPFFNALSCQVLIPFWYLIPIGTFATSLFILFTQWSTRMRAFGTISKANVHNSFWATVIKTCGSAVKRTPITLCAGYIVGRVVGLFVMAFKNIRAYGFPKSSFLDIKKVAVKYRKYPIYSAPGGIFNTMSLQIVPVLMVNLYSAKIAGLFSIAMKLIQLPSAIAGQALGQVFVQKGSQVKHEGKLKKIIKKAYISLMLSGVFPILFLSIYAPDLFSFFLGEKWYTAGIYASLLGPGIVFAFCFNPISKVFSILNLQDRFLFFQILNNFLKVLAIFAGLYFFKSPFYSVGLFSLANLIFSLFLTLWVFKKTDLDFKDIQQVMIIPLIKSLVIIFPNIPFLFYTGSTYLKAGVALSSCLIYADMLYKELKKIHYN